MRFCEVQRDREGQVKLENLKEENGARVYDIPICQYFFFLPFLSVYSVGPTHPPSHP